MPAETEELREWVTEMVEPLRPYQADIIEQVFVKTERDDRRLREYHQHEARHGHALVNRLIGRYTKEITGMHSARRAKAENTRLALTYTQLSRSV